MSIPEMDLSTVNTQLSNWRRELLANYRTWIIKLWGEWCLSTNSGGEICVDVSGEERSAAYLETNEKSVLSDLLSEVEQKEIFWDIGAHKGLFSLLVAEKIGGDNVFSFEPNEALTSIMKNLFYENGLSPSVYNLALSNREGEVELLSTGDTSGRGVINEGELGEYTEFSPQYSQNITQVTADSLVSEDGIESPSVVKIDVEGAEGLVLDGMRDILATDKCRTVYVEIHKPSDIGQSIEDFGFTVEDIFDVMMDYGYEYKVLAEEPGNLRMKFHK